MLFVKNSQLALVLVGHLANALQLKVHGAPGPFLENPFEHISTNEPAGRKIVLNSSAVNKYARCLDGTPAAYYFLEGRGDGVNKWLIHHEGK